MLGLKTVGLCGWRNKQRQDRGEPNPLTLHVGWIQSKCWALWLSRDLRVNSVPEELQAFFISLYLCREQHSKQSDTSLAAGGAGSWVVLKRIKQLFNCRQQRSFTNYNIHHLGGNRRKREIMRWFMRSSIISGFHSSGGRSKQRIKFQTLW